MFFLFSLKEMSATSTETDYTSSEYEEEEQEQETDPFKKIDLIKMAKINRKKGITKKISDSDDETETEQETEQETTEETTERTETNHFTCLNDEYKDKQTYKKMTTGRENNEEILLCCSDVKQNLNNYFAIDEEGISL